MGRPFFILVGCSVVVRFLLWTSFGLLHTGFLGFVIAKRSSVAVIVVVVLGFHNQAFNWTTNAWQFCLTVWH